MPSNPIETLEILQTAKKRFHDQLCRLSSDQSPDCIAELRAENTFILIEYLFMFSSLQIGRDADSLEAYIKAHNGYIGDLLKDREAQRMLGVSPQRVERGYFSEEHIQKARANLTLPVAGVDQADLQRLTVLLFSPETTRQTIEVIERAGFVQRVATPFRSKIVHSLGVVEELFRSYLEDIARGLEEAKTS